MKNQIIKDLSIGMPYTYDKIVKVYNQCGQDIPCAKKVLKILKDNGFIINFHNIANAIIEPDRKPTFWDKFKFFCNGGYGKKM